MKRDVKGRRQLVVGLGAAASAVALGSRRARAAASEPFEAARHQQDDWMDAMPGKHRIILDLTSPEALPDGIRFAGNLFTGHKNGYGLEDADVAIIVVLRHAATAFGYNNALWEKHGKALDSKADVAPTGNPYDSGSRVQLSALAKRGVQFVVCGSASLGLANRIAGAGADAAPVVKEMTANVIANGHLTMGVAGLVPLTHAQERGFKYVYVG
jgi:intracellular sulfur oxidation DsrE/DsrF family protein